MINIIKSKDNDKVKYTKSLLKTKFRNKEKKQMIITSFGSLCSGIEAASYVLEPMNIKPLWLSEIADFQSRFLSDKFPNVPNLGDMNDIPHMIEEG